jgi:hypothetical protein
MPAVSELLLIDVIAIKFRVVHGFTPLRCFRYNPSRPSPGFAAFVRPAHQSFVPPGYQVE